MTKISSKKVLKVTNNNTNHLDAPSIINNTTNLDQLSFINSSSDLIPPSPEVPSINSKENISVLETAPTTINLDDEDDTTDEENTEQQPNEPSSVWKYATRAGNKKFALCMICNKRISTNNWSTTALRRHLIHKHDKTELILFNQQLEETVKLSPMIKEKFHKLSVEAIIKDNLPFNAFTKSGLSKIMKEAIPGYRPIHRNIVTRRLKRLQHQKHNKLIEELKHIETITITMDFWSDRSNRSFLVITGHYYTNNHQQQSKILSFYSFNYRHTSEQISKIVKKRLQELHIFYKINRVVTDGAANLSKAIEFMGLDADHIWCIAHRLHLVVTNALALWPKKHKNVLGQSNQEIQSFYHNLNSQNAMSGNHQLSSKQSNINEIDRLNQSNNNYDDQEDDYIVEELLSMDNANYESLMMDGSNEVEDYEEDHDSEHDSDDDYENNENNQIDQNNENIEKNNDDFGDNNEDSDDDIDYDRYQNIANNHSDNDNVLQFIEENILDRWSESIEVDLNDSSLTKEQQLTLALMIKCRRLINMISKSSVLTLYFNHRRKLLKIKRNVLRDICIRWNSTFFMIDSLKKCRKVLEHLFNDKHNLNITNEQIEKLDQLEITSADWNYLNQLHHVLRIFHKATKIVSGKHYPSMGVAYFTLAKLKKFLLKDKEDNSTVKTLKKLLFGKMIHYFEEDRTQLNLLKFHSYLDPTGYRALSETDKRSIEYDIKQMYENDIINRANSSSLSSSSSILINSKISSTFSKTSTSSNSINSISSSKINKKKKLTAMESFLELIEDDVPTQEQENTRAIIVEELYNYRSSVNQYNNKNRPSTLSCIQFWKAQELILPYLFTLAKRYVFTPATSVPAEAAFSISSYVTRKERSRLSIKNIEATMFLKDKLDE